MQIDANWIMQTAILTGVGALGYFIKKDLKQKDDRITTVEAKCERIGQDLADLKSDLPFIYVTREDYVRCMNNFESKLDKIYDLIVRGAKDGQ